jgi:hypothetical protein
MSLSCFFAGDAVLRDEIGAALTRSSLLNVRANRTREAKKLIRERATDAGRLVELLAEFHHAPCKLEGSFLQVTPLLDHLATSLF